MIDHRLLFKHVNEQLKLNGKLIISPIERMLTIDKLSHAKHSFCQEN